MIMIRLMMTMVKFSFLTQARDSQSTGTPCCRQRNDHQPAMPRWPNTRWGLICIHFSLDQFFICFSLDQFSLFSWPISTPSASLTKYHFQSARFSNPDIFKMGLLCPTYQLLSPFWTTFTLRPNNLSRLSEILSLYVFVILSNYTVHTALRTVSYSFVEFSFFSQPECRSCGRSSTQKRQSSPLGKWWSTLRWENIFTLIFAIRIF